MKIVKTASGKNRIKMSKREWLEMGKKAGWMKEAQGYDSPERWEDIQKKREEIEPSDADIKEINKYIQKDGNAPRWAEDWAKKKLYEGTEPYLRGIWIPRINKFIEENGSPPAWAFGWARDKLEEGTESYVTKHWIPRINKAIKEDGYAPNFAIRWAKDNPEKIHRRTWISTWLGL